LSSLYIESLEEVNGMTDSKEKATSIQDYITNKACGSKGQKVAFRLEFAIGLVGFLIIGETRPYWLSF